MSIKVDFISEISFDDLYDKLTKHAAANNWLSLRREANSLLIEDGIWNPEKGCNLYGGFYG